MVRGEIGLVGAQHHRHIDTQGSEVRQPEQSNSLITVMIRIHQQNHIRLADLSSQITTFVRQSGGVDHGGGGDILGGSNCRRDGDLRQDRLDLVGNKDALDERSNETGLASAFITADADAHWSSGWVSGIHQSGRVLNSV